MNELKQLILHMYKLWFKQLFWLTLELCLKYVLPHVKMWIFVIALPGAGTGRLEVIMCHSGVSMLNCGIAYQKASTIKPT